MEILLTNAEDSVGSGLGRGMTFLWYWPSEPRIISLNIPTKANSPARGSGVWGAPPAPPAQSLHKHSQDNFPAYDYSVSVNFACLRWGRVLLPSPASPDQAHPRVEPLNC